MSVSLSVYHLLYYNRVDMILNQPYSLVQIVGIEPTLDAL